MLLRLGLAAARHPRRTFVIWFIAFAVSIAAAPGLFSALSTDMGEGDSTESQRVNDRIDDLRRSLPAPPPDALNETLIVVVDGVDAADPATERAVASATAAIGRLPGVTEVIDTYSTGDPELIAADGQALAVFVNVNTGGDDVPDETIDAVRAALEQTDAARVVVGNEDIVGDEIDAQAQEDLARGESIAMPIAFIALVIVFGGFLAATLPLALAFVSMAGALGVLYVATTMGDVAVYSINVVSMFGVGVGVDYGLILVSRFREERGAGLDVATAVERTVLTAGRTVMYSGLTVAVALAGLLVFDSSGLRSLAVGGIGVVLVAVVAGVTLLPALLMVAGRRIRPARVRQGHGAFWHLAGWVRRRAVPIVIVVGVGLAVAAVPFLGARFENPDARSLPRSSTARQLEELRARFPGGHAEPIEVLVETTPDDPEFGRYLAQIEALPGVANLEVDDQFVAAFATQIDVIPQGPTQGEPAQALVHDIRDLAPPFPAMVGGEVAELVDLKASIADRLPLALGLVGLATLVLLFLMTGSVVVAVKAVAMNVLSLGATFGVLVWVFQEGHLSGWLGFDSVGALDAMMPLVVFLFAFGLSMDYEVFLLARIKEAWDKTGDNDVAIASGLDHTGRIITSAAALLVIVFAGFAAGELVLIKQLGIGLAVAVIVDATIVRSLLVPATMTLMGRHNWWAPAPLRRLHNRLGLREAPPADSAARAERAEPWPPPLESVGH
jgi:RND superfamily putative drug exporter